MSSEGLDRARVAELVVIHANGRRRGSGYRVNGEAVLTAAHVLEDAVSVRVRFEPDLPGEWTVDALSWSADDASDLAAVRIAPRPDEPAPVQAGYGRIGTRAAQLPVQAVGFPRWKLRGGTGAGTTASASTGWFRDSAHVVGTVALLSHWRERTLEVVVSARPALLAPGTGGAVSPWEGMSGAALWAEGRIVGVVTKHHPGDDLGILTAARLDLALDELAPDVRELLQAPVQPAQLADVVRPLDQADEEFTDRYRAFVARTLNRFEFFGVDPRGIPRRHTFATGYVPLTVGPRDTGDDPKNAVTAGVRADQALGAQERALVRGVAGSGKSTLLRWLGVRAARAGADTGDPAPVPFLLELARFGGGRPPSLDQLIAPVLRSGMPEGWVDRMLAAGRVLLLLDALDEIPPRERVHVEDWVDEHVDTHPGTRCIVTTRPSVVAEQWWADRGFQRYDLLPMSRHSIDQYVHSWHDAARDDQPATALGDEVRRELTRCERQLLITLSNRPALRGMSDNPLLCGLLCALHLERAEHLPESRKQVYDAALDLLLVRWPYLRRRHRAADDGERAGSGAAPEAQAAEPPLRGEGMTKLLQRIAFWLVTNRQMVLTPELARRRVQSSMVGLRGDGDPERVLQYLAHQSGVVREQPDGSLEFIHRTFRDHLAAKEVVDEDNLSLLVDNADKPHWHDVAVMAGAHARPSERMWLLQQLLDRGRDEPGHKDALFLLAAAILEQTDVLPQRDEGSPDVRDQVNDDLAVLIPPRDRGAADQLAAAGPFVLDLLPDPRHITDEQAVLVVRAAARIAARWDNPAGAIEKILQYAVPGASPRVINELLEAWGRYGDYETYARDVLSQIDFSRFDVELQNGRRIDHISHLKSIVTLTLRNSVFDLTPLTELPRLRRLTLRDNDMTSLRPLPGVPSLRVLVLDRCARNAGARPVDLSPLRETRLSRLVIEGITTRVDLAGLSGVRLDSLRLESRPRDLDRLPAGLRVRHLSLVSGARRIRFDDVEGVRSVVVDWSPEADLPAMTAALPDLRRLVLRQVPPGTSVPPLPGIRVTVCGS
ncbi:NACHT domain-containing protein [Streptomyces sp. NPDC005538]|uniref:NACHT domain-containing protein n=1 Tax=unclassified Streptomyces TaxID=2593676 RepID=UPI0033B6A7A5